MQLLLRPKEKLKQFNHPNQPLSHVFYIDCRLDLEKLLPKLSVSAQFHETSDMLCLKPLEKLVFRPQSQGGKITDFQTPALASPDELSDPYLIPLRTHPEMKYFREGNPRC